MQLHEPLPLCEISLDTIHRKSWRCLDLETDDFYPLISGVHLKMTVENENDRIVGIGQLLANKQTCLNSTCNLFKSCLPLNRFFFILGLGK